MLQNYKTFENFIKPLGAPAEVENNAITRKISSFISQ